MASHHGRGSLRSISSHIDPEREEELRWAKMEGQNKMRRMRMIVRSMGNGNGEGSSRKRVEVIHLMEQIQKQYQWIHSLYEELRDEVKRSVDAGEEDDCSPSSDSEAFYTPLNTRNKMFVRSFTRSPDVDFREIEALDLDDTVLSHKLAFSRKSASLGSPLEFSEILEDAPMGGDLEKQVSDLKLEIEELRNRKAEIEEQIEEKCKQEMEMKKEVSRMEAKCREQELQVCSLTQKYEDNELMLLSRVQELLQKCDGLQVELATVKDKGDELESTSKTDESMDENGEAEAMVTSSSRDGEEGLKELIKDLEQVIKSLRNKESELENHVQKTSLEASQTNVENVKLRQEICRLQATLSVKESEIVTEQQKFQDCQVSMSMKIKSMEEEITSLKAKLEDVMIKLRGLETVKKQLQDELDKSKQESSSTKSQLERKNSDIVIQLEHQKKRILQLDALISKLSNEKEAAEAKLSANLQHIDRKVEEMAEEHRKVFEDQFRILSRRIRVAEQLQVELKEWYRKTKEAYEEVRSELQGKAVRNQAAVDGMKDVAIMTNDLLISLDSVSLKFAECSDNFLNRISKAACELNFAKHWAIRKNRAHSNANNEMDCLLAQLSDKEAEILCCREKLWKSENKVRELEKTLQDNEDSMLVLKEEKREAIRQLCVWIDYHRSRSEFFKKMVSEMNKTRRRAA